MARVIAKVGKAVGRAAIGEPARMLGGRSIAVVCRSQSHADLRYAPPRETLPHEGQKLLSEIKHPVLWQSVRDYFVNQQFRQDVFVKGPLRLQPLEQSEALRAQAFVLTTHPDDVPMKIKGEFGEGQLQERIYRPLIEVLAENTYAPKTIDHLNAHDRLQFLKPDQLIEALLVLVGTVHAHPAQPSERGPSEYCQRLNRHLLRRARSSADIAFLASPVTGGGVPVTQFEQLFLLGMQEGKRSAAELAAFAWTFNEGRGITKDGKVLKSAEENIAELDRIAQYFTSKRVAILKALKVI